MLESHAHDLLLRAQAERAVELFGLDPQTGDEALAETKRSADLLVGLRLARFEDEGRTRLILTNPGRYWALNGGYMAFLKEEPERAAGGNGRGRNPEMEQLRFNFMMLRMRTFWWSFGISVASFLMSSVSLVIALRFSQTLALQ